MKISVKIKVGINELAHAVSVLEIQGKKINRGNIIKMVRWLLYHHGYYLSEKEFVECKGYMTEEEAKETVRRYFKENELNKVDEDV